MPERLCWRSHPLVDDTPRSVLLVGLLTGASVAAGVAFGGVGYAVIAAVVLCGSMGRYLLPTRFELDGSGAASSFLGHRRVMPWEAVQRVSVHREGVHLSPFDRPSRLDSFRGTFLRFAGNADEVVSFVEAQTAANG